MCMHACMSGRLEGHLKNVPLCASEGVRVQKFYGQTFCAQGCRLELLARITHRNDSWRLCPRGPVRKAAFDYPKLQARSTFPTCIRIVDKFRISFPSICHFWSDTICSKKRRADHQCALALDLQQPQGTRLDVPLGRLGLGSQDSKHFDGSRFFSSTLPSSTGKTGFRC